MKVAVIGDYSSPQYKDLLQRVRLAIPDVEIIDLSRHTTGTWKQQQDHRKLDIKLCSLVVLGYDWRCSIEARNDLTLVQNLHKEYMEEQEGTFAILTPRSPSI